MVRQRRLLIYMYDLIKSIIKHHRDTIFGRLYTMMVSGEALVGPRSYDLSTLPHAPDIDVPNVSTIHVHHPVIIDPKNLRSA